MPMGVLSGGARAAMSAFGEATRARSAIVVAAHPAPPLQMLQSGSAGRFLCPGAQAKMNRGFGRIRDLMLL